jgi:pyrroloquinoline quinone (PQQ) biosynthesis protein C
MSSKPYSVRRTSDDHQIVQALACSHAEIWRHKAKVSDIQSALEHNPLITGRSE